MDPVIGTLLGAAVGATGTISVQVITTFASERAQNRAIALSLRNEKRAAVEEFLDVYQALEARADKKEPRDSVLMQRLWIARNKLALIGSDQLQEPLNIVAYRLDDLYKSGLPEGQTAGQYMQVQARAFREAARRELQLK